MRTRNLGLVLVASMSLGACASNGGYRDDYYGEREDFQREGRGALAGAAVGGAVGAGVGAVIPGVSAGEGAVAGAVVGGIVGAATANNNDRRWYRDRRGDCYYVDSRGEWIYDYDRRC